MTSTSPAREPARRGSGAAGSSRRRTSRRDAIVGFLHDQVAFHTAQEIHSGLRATGVAVGLATVYRTLQAMAAEGELDVLRTDSGEAQYRRCRLDSHHHHLVCRGCGHTVEVVDDPVARWADDVGSQHGFSQIEHQVEVFGVCTGCRAS